LKLSELAIFGIVTLIVVTLVFASFSAAPLITTNHVIQKVLAVETSTSKATPTGVNTINTTSFGKPYLVLKGKNINTRVIDVNNGPTKVEDTIVLSGVMNGINVTETETNLVSGTGYGAGQGIVMANDGEMATYNLQGYGPHNSPLVHGLHIYSTTSTGKLAFLNNIVGIVEYDLAHFPSVLVKEWARKQ
jgi:hypothetical protein